MTQPKERGSGPAQPYWETHYEQRDVEAMPWFYEALDPDVERALGELRIGGGRVLDLGTGPGTQAIALAERGFVVTGSDLSKAAVAKASERAATRGADVRFVVDDVLDSKLDGPFDVLLDRGCFHVLPAPRRVDCVATLARLAAPGGWLLLKTFSVDQPGETGPFRFAPETIRSLFGSAFDRSKAASTTARSNRTRSRCSASSAPVDRTVTVRHGPGRRGRSPRRSVSPRDVSPSSSTGSNRTRTRARFVAAPA